MQSRLIMILGGFGIICSLGVSMLIYSQYHDYIISSVQNTLRDAGELIESQMLVLGEVEYIRREGIEESEAYMNILRELQRYSDAFGFVFIYLIENGADGFIFLLDTDKLGKNTDSTFLTAASNEVAMLLPRAIKSRRIELSDIYTSKFGTFMSAFVPVVRQDKVVSVIGIDYDVLFIRSLEHRALLQILFSLFISIVIVIILTVIISRKFFKQVKKMDKLNRRLLSMNENLTTLSTTDELTKLNNRRSFLEYMDIVWKQNHRLKLPITVLMIDVDYFKKYNDTLGHLEGDKALVAAARCIKEHAKRETDFVARFGGEEFVCVLPFIEKNEAAIFANTLVAKVEGMKIPHPTSEHSEYLTVSVGMAGAVPDDNNSYTQLLDEADKALYAAKESGRNRVVVA